jgi:hypothetical protein
LYFTPSRIPRCRRGGARDDVDAHLHVGDAFDLANGGLGIARDLRAGIGILGLEADGERDVAAVDADVVNESE